MEELLRELLADLAAIMERHKEINDVEELMTDCIFDGFLKPAPGFSLPITFGMSTAEGTPWFGLLLLALLNVLLPLPIALG